MSGEIDVDKLADDEHYENDGYFRLRLLQELRSINWALFVIALAAMWHACVPPLHS